MDRPYPSDWYLSKDFSVYKDTFVNTLNGPHKLVSGLNEVWRYHYGVQPVTPVYLPLSSCIRAPGSFRPVGAVKDNRGKNAYSWKSQPEAKQEVIRSSIQVKFEYKGGEIPNCLRL